MKISIGSNHAGYELKEKIKQHLVKMGMEVVDRGTHTAEPVDYPDFARPVAEDVAGSSHQRGILVSGSGIGMAIAANKIPGIRAASVSDELEAQLSREQNDANVLTLGSRFVDDAKAVALVDTWLAASFSGGRHQQRVDKIAQLERSAARRAHDAA